MTELEKIEYTKGFVDKLAEGINPIDGTPIAEGDLSLSKKVTARWLFSRKTGRNMV